MEKARASRVRRDLWLSMFIPLALLGGLFLLVNRFTPPESLMPLLGVVGAGVIAGGTVGFYTGVRGPHWIIYALIFVAIVALYLLSGVWRGFALVSTPILIAGFSIGKELDFFRRERRDVSLTEWVVASEPIADIGRAKEHATSNLRSWDSVKDGRFVVALGYRRFEAWGSASEGFIVHVATDVNDIETLHVLTRSQTDDDEVPISLNSHGLTAWIPSRLRASAEVVQQALEAFMETQTAAEVPGWNWEAGDLAQEVRFME